MRKIVIKCPHCGCEYMVAEIFTSEFLGHPGKVIRDENGVILGYDGTDVDLSESYICDRCDKEFKVDASLSFKVTKINNVFDEDDDLDVSGE